MKIALVAGEEEGWGGIGTYTWVLGRALVALGHTVDLIVRGWEEAVVEDVGGLTVHRVPVSEPEWHRLSEPLVSRVYGTRAALAFSRGVARVLHGMAPDVVEIPEFGAGGLIPALRGRTPVVVRLHTPSFMTRRLERAATGLDDRLGDLLERFAAHRARLVTAPSAAMADLVGARWRLHRPGMPVVPNPIDGHVFRPAPDPPVPGRIVIVGRVERAKGHDLLLEALPAVRAAVPESHVLAIGADDGQVTALRRRAEQLGVADRITFRGAVARANLPALYRSGAVCVVPSRFESFSYTAAEAMACGRAVVATRVGALPEVVTDGVAGRIVEPESPAALAQGLIELLGDPVRRAELERGARAVVESRFAAPTVARTMVEVYGTVLA